MKKILQLITAVAFIVALTGCEDEIDLKLDQEQYSKLVVEGWITDHQDKQSIKLTRTAPYDSNEPCPPVTGATVTVDDGNALYPFYETAPGLYENNSFRGVPGKTYRLKITIDKESYQATSTMPNGFVIDSVHVEKFHRGYPAHLPHYQLLVFGQENPQPDQFYVFRYARNGVWNDTMLSWSFLNDFAINGKYIQGAPATVIESTCDEFDVMLSVASVEQEYLQFIDHCIYSYMPDMFFSPPPATVTGNVTNGALGYFAAASVSVSQPLTIRKRDFFPR